MWFTRWKCEMNIYDFVVTNVDGTQQSLSDYENKVLLVVNTASHCGFTPQYKALQKLYERYEKEGFSVLAFPCNQFANQEPAENQEIKQFCQLSYDITFPVFAKCNVNGQNCEPLFSFLKSNCKGIAGSEAIKWNFTKFLINKNGIPIKRYAPIISPNQIAGEIERQLFF
jgi:glutathione peroxidase